MQYTNYARKNASKNTWRIIVTKLNSTIYNKLFAQAEEAKEQGLVKLADHIMDAIEKQPEVEVPEYS